MRIEIHQEPSERLDRLQVDVYECVDVVVGPGALVLTSATHVESYRIHQNGLSTSFATNPTIITGTLILFVSPRTAVYCPERLPRADGAI